ncbi:MAG: imidazolonepropionase [Candidatus Aminicenantaceae bacterium]
MRSADLVVKNCSQLLTCKGPIPKRNQSLQNIGLLENACIASYKGIIVFIGDEKKFEQEIQLENHGIIIDGKGLVCLPGFIDSHTHLPFGGTREEEFNLRIKGYTYQQLSQKGMGIQTSVNSTRQSSLEELKSLCLSRLESMLLHGTTTTEAKSGYGLNLEDEIKQLEVIKQVNELHPVDIVATFMGAHEIPNEYKNQKKKYIDFLLNQVLPEVKKKNLAEFFDVFCEEGVFSAEDTKILIKAAKKAGFKIKIHADEFSSLGGAELAAEEQAFSADHLIAISEEGIKKLSKSKTTATLLPGVSFFLMQNKVAPARKLIKHGAAVALASDFNPGSSMTESMLFILCLAVFTMNLTIEEAINASTANAAYALDRHHSVGSLELGKKMDILLCDLPNYLHLVYHLGINPIKHVIKNGQWVVKDGNVIYHRHQEM